MRPTLSNFPQITRADMLRGLDLKPDSDSRAHVLIFFTASKEKQIL